jgi:ubiquinone/menaquinone biosynthesis C-methylase UbiE
MGIYSDYVLPRLIDVTCGLEPAMRQRAKVVPRARGRVLELGIGSGLNLPYYDAALVTRVHGLDPSAALWRLAAERRAAAAVEVEFLEASAEAIPLADASIDTVVVTYTLCTLPDVPAALAEARRVLREGGELLFCEHGAAPDRHVRRWQDRLDPLWQRLAGGCHLNRDTPSMIEAAGFRIRDLDSMYLPGWRPASFNVWGVAAPLGRSRRAARSR